jgi:DNA-binding MarR family transcriptional regulator
MHHCDPPPSEDILRAIAEVFGSENSDQMELFRRLKAVSHVFSHVLGEHRKDGHPSAARMRLLIRLKVEPEGLAPSELSRFLGVSRNTVSALLNALEDQGLIERRLHPSDRRRLMVQITPEGEELVEHRAPKFSGFIATLFDSLSPEEQHELRLLLDKLLAGMIAKLPTSEE